MSVVSQELINLATHILEDKEGFAKQDEMNEAGIESVLTTKTYNSKNIPSEMTESELEKYELFGNEIVKVEGIVDLPIEDLAAILKRPDIKHHANPKILKCMMLEDNYSGNPDCFVTYAQMSSGSSFVSSRSNLVQNTITKQNGSIQMTSRSLPDHPKLSEIADEKKESIVRANYHCQAIKYESLGANKTKYTMFVSVSLEGMIPGFVQKTLLRKTPLEIPKGWMILKQHL